MSVFEGVMLPHRLCVVIETEICYPHLALLGGSYCSTQLTSAMSMPLAITSVHTRIPL